ncbi:putative phosphoesterase YjcG [Arthrobacter sp. SO5]|uniref:2'-5' RNA ligase family protein n=1 Tax=Arthrobacter sp. SO5 TaxID=1897055 RepID=UPI001E63A0F9|nr:2'-5' RNA ligase family protein [Arthrobacter sp. SO5]MCB5273427.1 putative phosphoesterase YjcG [Arthrobacter sp. SO5]
MASVSRVAAHEPQRVTARAGSKAAAQTQTQAHSKYGQRSEGIGIGVILGFPAEIAEELQRWRASFGDPMAGVVPAHITLVTTTMTQDWEATRNHVREVARRQKPFTVTIAGTGSFRPVSPVVFLNVEDGFGDCVSLHQQLQTGPLERDLQFSYHPHVTVAHDVAPESLDEAETVLRDYRATFPVASMGLYEHDDNGIWQLREELDFGTEPHHDRGQDGTAGAG